LYVSPELDSDTLLPKVSIIVPAFNEENTIGETIESLRLVDYPKELFEIVVINDGSTDKTAEVVRSLNADGRLIFIDNQENKGKAARLNQGLEVASGEFVACTDADSLVAPDVFKKTLPYFKNSKTGAVTITVEVNKPRNLLERIVEIEYIIGLSLALKVLSLFNSIHVTPGPFSVYRKTLLDVLGGFDAGWTTISITSQSLTKSKKE